MKSEFTLTKEEFYKMIINYINEYLCADIDEDTEVDIVISKNTVKITIKE